MCVYIYINVCVCKFGYVCTHAWLCMCIHVCKCVSMRTWSFLSIRPFDSDPLSVSPRGVRVCISGKLKELGKFRLKESDMVLTFPCGGCPACGFPEAWETSCPWGPCPPSRGGFLWMCVCMYVCMHACMPWGPCPPSRGRFCMNVCVYVCMYACMYACMHACVCVYICVCVCVSIWLRLHCIFGNFLSIRAVPNYMYMPAVALQFGSYPAERSPAHMYDLCVVSYICVCMCMYVYV